MMENLYSGALALLLEKLSRQFDISVEEIKSKIIVITNDRIEILDDDGKVGKK